MLLHSIVWKYYHSVFNLLLNLKVCSIENLINYDKIQNIKACLLNCLFEPIEAILLMKASRVTMFFFYWGKIFFLHIFFLLRKECIVTRSWIKLKVFQQNFLAVMYFWCSEKEDLLEWLSKFHYSPINWWRIFLAFLRIFTYLDVSLRHISDLFKLKLCQ